MIIIRELKGKLFKNCLFVMFKISYLSHLSNPWRSSCNKIFIWNESISPPRLFFFFFIKICFTRDRWFFLKFYVFWNGWTQRYPDFIVWNVKNSMFELGLWCVRFAIFQNRESFVIASTFFFFYIFFMMKILGFFYFISLVNIV